MERSKPNGRARHGPAVWAVRRSSFVVGVVTLALLSALLAPAPQAGQAARSGRATTVAAVTPAIADTTNLWQSIGPEGGLLYTVAVDPQNPATLYAGTYGGSIFKSSDGGASWHSAAAGVPPGTVYDLAVNPSAPATIYAASGSSIYRSDDGAQNWYRAGGFPATVDTIAIDPQHPSTLFAGLIGVVGGPPVYRSTDGGASWAPVGGGVNSSDVYVLAIDPAKPATVYAGAETGVYKSTDGGLAWARASTGLPATSRVYALALSRSSPQTLYAGVYDTASYARRVYKSINGGASWSPTGLADLASDLDVDPANPATVYATTFDRVYRSTDGGDHWTEVVAGLPGSTKRRLALDPVTPATLYVTTYNGIFKSTSAGAEWRAASNGLVGSYIDTMAVDPVNPDVVYAGTAGGVYRTVDGGQTWSLSNSGIDRNLFIESLAVDPSERNVVYAGTYGVLYRSDDSGLSWQRTPGALPSGDVKDLAIDPLAPATLYVRIDRSTSAGIYKSADSGASWGRIDSGLPTGGLYYYRALAIDPVNPLLLYTGTSDGVFKTTDGGAHWFAASDGLPARPSVDSLAVDPVSPATVYACVSGSIFRSSDGGARWRQVSEPLGCAILLVDPTDHTTIYAGVQRGVYRSTDGGEHWGPFRAGATVPAATTLALVPASPIRIYAGTHTGGVFSLRFGVGGVSVDLPAQVVAGAPFAVTATVLRLDGTVASDYSGPVALSLRANSGVKLGGPIVGTASSGIARFDGLTIDRPGAGYRLDAVAGDLGSGASPPFGVVTPGKGSIDEQEPNETIEQATSLVLDRAGRGEARGAIGSASDIDVYTITTLPGATIAISLTTLPADYDLLLLADPRAIAGRSDEVDVGNLSDIAQKSIAQKSIAQKSIAQKSIAQKSIAGASANPGATDEVLELVNAGGGLYFVVVYAAGDAYDAVHPYRLRASVREGALRQPVLRAQAGRGINARRDPSVRTLFVTNLDRMAAVYPDEGVMGGLRAMLADPRLLEPGAGVLLDLRAGLDPAARDRLDALYRQWDTVPDQPLLANEVAQQIWFILDRAISTYYPNTTSIVLVGADAVVPFYRIPDETRLGNERDYATALQTAGGLDLGTPLAGSLRYGFFQTDDFYADRAPTAWRGRFLYVPDQAIGRLVERPLDIVRYLNGYLKSETPDRYTVRADRVATPASAAFVTGYDFLSDQAGEIAAQLGRFGFGAEQGAQLTGLIGDDWNVTTLEDAWFSGQLPAFSGRYSGVTTRFQVTSLNAHFSHYDLLPARSDGGVFDALRLYEPTAVRDAIAFFKYDGTPTLLYSVGCHAGLSAADAAFSSDRLRADFPQAVIKQGGNWIGNTGYGVGDTDVVGYSERLALLFTRAIGRGVTSRGAYIGAPLGESLALAKRQYLQTSGPNGFGVFDEKIMGELTLYGLPFIRVRVPHPQPTSLLAPPAIPPAITPRLIASGGVFTREIALNVTFAPLTGGVPRVEAVAVDDSFTSGAPRELVVTTITGAGRPVLPALVYDLTLKPNTTVRGIGNPEVRGVRLRQVETLPDIDQFDPTITTPITDRPVPRAAPETALDEAGVWLPEIPYTFQRTVNLVPGGAELVGGQPTDVTDKLIVVPVQVRAERSDSARLRRLARLVVEVTYLDPRTAPAESYADTTGPAFELVEVLPALSGRQVTLRARFADDPCTAPEVTAVYTADGRIWRRVQLTGGCGTLFSTTVPAIYDQRSFAVFFEALDKAGNVTTGAPKTGVPLRPPAGGPVNRLPLVGR